MRHDLPAWCRRFWPAAFFAGFLILGLRIAGDYGLYIDEFTNHYFGVRWYDYVHDLLVKHVPLGPLAGATEHDVIHGPVFELALAGAERAILHLSAIPPIVLFRHYATWVLFYLSVVSFYFLARRLFASRPLALLACLFLVVQPRIFSHSFYDSVDIPFLSFYIFSLATLVRYLERRTLGTLALHALGCALLIDIRAMGAVIPALTTCLLGIAVLVPPAPPRPLLHRLGVLAGFMALVALGTILFWPFLWNHPFQRVLEVLRDTPKANWNGLVLYLGREINATNLPWHYIPWWILITTPLVISGLFFIGLARGLWGCLRHPVAYYRDRLAEGVILAAFLGPLLAVILLKAIVYDAWRHLFFVYPAFALLAIAGLQALLRGIEAGWTGRVRLLLKSAVAAVIALNLTSVVAFMIRSHPYENVYFNRLAGRDLKEIKSRFEMDYWGLSYRAALEHVMAIDPANPIKIYHSNNALLAINRQILSPADEARIQQVEWDDAQYVFTTFRQVREGYPALPEFFTIKVDSAGIFCVYKKEPKAR